MAAFDMDISILVKASRNALPSYTHKYEMFVVPEAVFSVRLSTLHTYDWRTICMLRCDICNVSNEWIHLQYFGVFEAGTPAKQFTGCFDTGSADAWLPLSSCQSPACTSHTTYSPNTSSTYQACTDRNTFQLCLLTQVPVLYIAGNATFPQEVLLPKHITSIALK